MSERWGGLRERAEWVMRHSADGKAEMRVRAADVLALLIERETLRSERIIAPEHLEISNGWLVERLEHGDEIPGYGMLPGSDLVPIVDLSALRGWSLLAAVREMAVAMGHHQEPGE